MINPPELKYKQKSIIDSEGDVMFVGKYSLFSGKKTLPLSIH